MSESLDRRQVSELMTRAGRAHRHPLAQPGPHEIRAQIGGDDDATAAGGMVPGETPDHGTGTPHETPSTAVTSLPATPERIRPANPYPRCKLCGGEWNGGAELLCEAHAEQYVDFWADSRDEEEL